MITIWGRSYCLYLHLQCVASSSTWDGQASKAGTRLPVEKVLSRPLLWRSPSLSHFQRRRSLARVCSVSASFSFHQVLCRPEMVDYGPFLLTGHRNPPGITQAANVHSTSGKVPCDVFTTSTYPLTEREVGISFAFSYTRCK